MAEKRTRKVILNEMLGVQGIKENTEYTETLEKIIAQIDKKNSYKGETATQVANEKTKALIIDTLAKLGDKARISTIQSANSELPTSNQKMSALLTQLVKENKVERIEEKKIAYFKLKD